MARVAMKVGDARERSMMALAYWLTSVQSGAGFQQISFRNIVIGDSPNLIAHVYGKRGGLAP
jgi:hypothetical protein